MPSDVYARYERMKGNDVLMVSGTDEHGTPILVEAEKEGLTAQELANRYNRVIAKDLCDLGLSYDLFTRTTTGNHTVVAVGQLLGRETFLLRLNENRGTVLIGAGDHEHIIAFHALVTRVNVGGHTKSCDMTNMTGAVSIRPSNIHQNMTHNV